MAGDIRYELYAGYHSCPRPAQRLFLHTLRLENLRLQHINNPIGVHNASLVLFDRSHSDADGLLPQNLHGSGKPRTAAEARNESLDLRPPWVLRNTNVASTLHPDICNTTTALGPHQHVGCPRELFWMTLCLQSFDLRYQLANFSTYGDATDRAVADNPNAQPGIKSPRMERLTSRSISHLGRLDFYGTLL